jgi:trans-aconitate methyltransferase
MARSWIYCNGLVYELVMLGLYGRHYGARYRAVADQIPDGTSVLELCCGPGVLFDRYLRSRPVEYTGIDVNPQFIAQLNRRGGRGLVADVCDRQELPEADVVVMQASLYQFLPDASPVVRRMLRAAHERVIIAEPVRNLSTSANPLLRTLARRQTDAGLGARPSRFTEASLDEFVDALGVRLIGSLIIPGGREKLVVLDPRRRTLN